MVRERNGVETVSQRPTLDRANHPWREDVTDAEVRILNTLLELLVHVGRHPDSMWEGAPLNKPFTDASAVLHTYCPPPKELKNATEHVLILPD